MNTPWRSAILVALAIGCPRQGNDPVQPPDPGGDQGDRGEPEPAGDEPDVAPLDTEVVAAGTCHTPEVPLADRFHSLGAQATLAAIIDLRAPERTAALAHLSAYARAEGGTLPVTAAFALSQWSWEIPLLQQALGRLGFAGAELGTLRLPNQPPLWFSPLGCDLEQARARLARVHGLRISDVGDALIATPTAGALAYDLVLTQDLLVLAPAGSARRVFGALRVAATGLPPPGRITPGQRLKALGQAPVRLVLAGPALVTVGGPTAQADRSLVVDGGGVHDATVPGS